MGREDIEAAFDAFFNPRGLRAWQLAEEHGLALQWQAGEHHHLEEGEKRYTVVGSSTFRTLAILSPCFNAWDLEKYDRVALVKLLPNSATEPPARGGYTRTPSSRGRHTQSGLGDSHLTSENT